MSAHELLARAFQDDPFICWAEPNAERRPRTMASIFEGQLRYARSCGGYLHEPGVGAVDWRDGAAAHLGWWSVFTHGVWRVATVAPPTVWRRLQVHEDAAMVRVQPFLRADAVYVCSLGVEPSLAGRGHGGRLLQRALTIQAPRWRTVVLRTEQPRNLAFYKRHGFEVVDDLIVPVSGLRCWIFSRSLRA